MKDTILNKNSLHFKFYKASLGPEWEYKPIEFIYDDPADWGKKFPQERNPTNMCPYFWESVGLWLFLPFTWLGYFIMPLIKRKIGETESTSAYEQKMLATLFVYCTLAFIYAVGTLASPASLPILLKMVVGLLTIAMVVSAGALGWIFMRYIKSKYRVYVMNKPPGVHTKSSGLLKAQLRAWYDKKCPSITWVENEK